jgi:hypothetical protein
MMVPMKGKAQDWQRGDLVTVNTPRYRNAPGTFVKVAGDGRVVCAVQLSSFQRTHLHCEPGQVQRREGNNDKSTAKPIR